MPKFMKISIFVVLAFSVVYGIGRTTGPSVATEIEIAAPAAAVWAVLADTKGHADWNPFLISMSGDLQEGAQLRNVLQFEDGTQMEFTPKVLVAKENSELRWLGHMGVPGIFDGEHYFVLEETDRGTTLFHHGENFTGLLAYPIYALIREDTKTAFKAMNMALKERAEGNQ